MSFDDRERVSSETSFSARKFDVLKTKRGKSLLGIRANTKIIVSRNSTQRKQRPADPDVWTYFGVKTKTTIGQERKRQSSGPEGVMFVISSDGGG